MHCIALPRHTTPRHPIPHSFNACLCVCVCVSPNDMPCPYTGYGNVSHFVTSRRLCTNHLSRHHQRNCFTFLLSTCPLSYLPPTFPRSSFHSTVTSTYLSLLTLATGPLSRPIRVCGSHVRVWPPSSYLPVTKSDLGRTNDKCVPNKAVALLMQSRQSPASVSIGSMTWLSSMQPRVMPRWHPFFS